MNADLGPSGVCPDLDGNLVNDCQETLPQNPDFDAAAAPWAPDFVGAVSWMAGQDAQGNPASGALAVRNTTVLEADGTSLGGAQQCVPVTADRSYRLMLELFIAPSQSAGSGGANLQFFESSDCTGPVKGAYLSVLVSQTGAWKKVEGTPRAPAGARSALVKLVVAKAFRTQPLQILFDNVLLRPQ